MSINSSHPLASSCVYAAATSTLSGGTLVDEVNGLNGSGFTADGTGFTSASSVTLGTNTALDGLGARSLFVRAKVKTGVTSDDYLVGKGANVFSGGGWHLRTRASSDKNLGYTIDGSGGDPSVTSPDDVYTLDGDYVDLVVRYNGSNALALDVDGVANSIVPVGTPKANTSDLLINFGGHFTFEYIYIFDSEITYAEGESLRASPQTLIEAAVADTTAPILSSPTGVSTGETTATGSVTTDESNGTLYYYASINSSETAATIKSSGASQAVSATGSQSVAFSSLSFATNYYAHYVQDDAAGNESLALSSAGFTTDTPLDVATTGDVPLTIQAGYTKVDLVSPVTTNASLLFGVTGDAPVTGDDLEYSVTSVLNSGVTFSVAADGVWTITEASDGDWTTAITVDRRVVQADGTIGTEATMTFDPRVGAPAAAGSIPYAMRQMAMRLSFHSYLIQESKGRWEQDQLNAAIVALGGSAMTPPVGAPDAAVGYTGTQTYLEFYKRLQRALVYPTPIDVVPAVQAALLARGWTL